MHPPSLQEMQHVFSQLHSAASATQQRYAANPESRETVQITRLTDALRNTNVTTVWFHGSKTGRGDVKALHWRLFFELEGGTHSVEFNSQQVMMDGTAKLFVTYRRYLVSNNALVRGCWSVPMTTGITASMVLALLLQKGRDRYRFNNLGSGCRFWCKTVLMDLESSNYITSGAGDYIESKLKELHEQIGNQWVPYPLVQGAFY